MKLYHTSNIEVSKPNIKFSRNHLDFGKGFYLTKFKEQAVKYGQRFLKKEENAFLNVYELDDKIMSLYTNKVFENYDGEWLDYVAACRKGLPRQEYDIVEGGIADDQVFDTIDLYFTGLYTREQALDQLQYKKPNHQVCITNQSLIDNYLQFLYSEKL